MITIGLNQLISVRKFMCGRFQNKKTEKELVELFEQNNLELLVDDEIDKRKKDDIRPTEKIAAIFSDNEKFKLSKVIWGIKFKEDSPLIFNSRIETIKDKTYWKKLFTENKCVVPMTGFYEWNNKIRYKIFLPEKDIFFVPAIYHKDKEKNIFASLITTTPNKFISEIHNRMPVILDFQNAISFLNDPSEENIKRCVPYNDENEMEAEAV